MTVEIIRTKEEEREKEELTPEEIRRRVRYLVSREPEVLFALIEELMDKLEIPREKQEEIIKEALNKWMNY